MGICNQLSTRDTRFHPQSTGEMPVVSTPSRTKDNADHAGLSLPPEPLRLPHVLPLEPLSPSPSKSLLTVLSDTETWPAMVDGTTKLGITSLLETTTSSHSLVESSWSAPNAEVNSITPSPLLDTEPRTEPTISS